MKKVTNFLFFTSLSVLFFSADFSDSTQFGFVLIQDTQARVGRPLTPVSVAGVRRRTRRRTAVATAAVVAAPVVVATPVVVAPAPAPVIIVKP